MKLTHPDEIKKLAGLIVELAALAVKNGESVPFIEKGDSVKQLRAQPPEQVAAKFFSWLGKVAPQLSSLLKTAEARTIGHLKDGDTVYVVTKLSMKMEGEIIESTDVLPLKKMGDSYGMLLKADMTQMLRGMKKQLEAAKEK